MTAPDDRTLAPEERAPRSLHEIAHELRNSQTVGSRPLEAIADELDAIAVEGDLAHDGTVRWEAQA